jgi:hypothetical protein
MTYKRYLRNVVTMLDERITYSNAKSSRKEGPSRSNVLACQTKKKTSVSSRMPGAQILKSQRPSTFTR